MSKLMEYARNLENQCKFEDALNYYEMVIEEKGCPFDIRCDIGRVLNKTGQYQEALDCFDLVLTMDENHLESLFGRAISLIGLNRWIDAFNSLVEAVNLDSDNANYWYYLAIILKEYGEDKSREYFRYFRQLDNENFSKIRSNYEFGLIFKQRENELLRRKKALNINGFRDELLSYGLSGEEAEGLLRTMPYEELLFHMHCLKDLHKQKITKEIIKEALGLNDIEVMRMYELEDEEKIKQSVISIIGHDPFSKLDGDINIPLYEKTGLFRFIDNHKTDANNQIRLISVFNRFVDVMEAKNMPKFKRRTFDYAYQNSQFQINTSDSINLANDSFNQAKKAIVHKNYSDAIVFLDNALKNCPADYYNIYNIKFYYATLLSKFKSLDYKLLAYRHLDDIENKFRYFKNKDVYLLNKACIAYDLSFYYLDFTDRAIYYLNKYLELNGKNEDIEYLLNSIYMRKNQTIGG